MKEQEKELLLRDLSARLPYGVIVDYKEDEYDFHHWKISTLHAPAYSQNGSLISTDSDGWIEYEEYKGCGISTGSRPLQIETTPPFLRPMSSMTEKEKKQYDFLTPITEVVFPCDAVPLVDWLNSHYFDYRGLIEKGLAIEAPEGMYNTKEK